MENSNGVNKKIIVRSALGISILVFSFLFWLTLTNALNNGPDWIEKSVWSLAIFLFLGAGAGLAYLIEDGNILFFGLPPLMILPALVFLPENLATGLVLAAALAFLALAAWRVGFEKSLRIEFVSWIILKKGLGPAITALALVITLFFYWAPFTQSFGEKISVPRPLFDALARPAADLVLNINSPRKADLTLVPEFEKQKAEVLDKIYLSTNEEISAAGESFKKWIPLGVSVSLFFGLKVVGTFLSWLAMLFSWLAFRILLWSGVVKINKVTTEKEIIEI